MTSATATSPKTDERQHTDRRLPPSDEEPDVETRAGWLRLDE